MLVWALLILLGGSADASTDQMDGGSQSPVLPEVWNELALEYLSREEGQGCTECQEVRKILEARLPEVNITQIRLEIFKEDLLRRLGMSKPPTPQPGTALPDPVLQGAVFHEPDHHQSGLSELVGTTERVVLMAHEAGCSQNEQGVSVDLRFELPQHTSRGTVVNAKLWFQPMPAANFLNGLIIGTHCNSSSHFPPRAIRLEDSHLRGAWIESDVTRLIHTDVQCFHFKIAYLTDNSSRTSCSLFEEPEEKPFLLVDISTNLEESGRDKRNVDCVDGLTDCCREKLYVSFASIGWDDWIIQPRGYEAYYCKGSCANIASISLGASPYHSVIKKLSSEGNFVHIKPCCTPTKLSSVQLIYKDHNSTVVQKTIPNLTVEACGCM